MADASDKKAETSDLAPTSADQISASKPDPTENEDSDPDFDDLDDVLDQFSANAPGAASQPPSSAQQPSQSAPAASGPGRPASPTSGAKPEDEPVLPSGPKPDESEEDFIARLSKEMSAMIGSLSNADPSKAPQSPEDIAKMGKELEEFTQKMEDEGIKPEDLLKALLGPEEGEKLASLAHEERDRLEKSPLQSSSSQQGQTQPSSSSSASKPETQRPSSSSSSAAKPPPKSFEDTIRSTMSRLGESDKSATTAAQKQSQKSEEDLLADMLRALESNPSGDPNSDEGLSKMFMDMMQQLTHKDLLYEPMKELNDQYPEWLEKNKATLKQDEFDRYTRQSGIVADITRKFEEPGFSDDDPACREFIWERMQKMQEEGAPPEELVKNPFPGTDMGGIPGLGGGGEGLPEGLEKELEEGCPTQ